MSSAPEMLLTSVLAFTTRALSPDGITLIATMVASRPMMTITTMSSTRVKPCSRRRGSFLNLVRITIPIASPLIARPAC